MRHVDSRQYHGPAGALQHGQGLRQQQPGEARCDHRLQQQPHRGERRGQVREQTRIFERAWLVAEVPRREAAQGETFYVRHGDWLPALCAALVLGCALRGARRGHG